MHRILCLLLAVSIMSPETASAFDFSGRFSLLGAQARAGPGELGYVDGADERLSTDRQSVRLMLDGGGSAGEWSLHFKVAREHIRGYSQVGTAVSPFRFQESARNWRDESSDLSLVHELDRALYKQRFDNLTLALGRQPIDWGSGRFWQPLNVFGAFAPTALDTDYKPGIDAAVCVWYPSAFSSLAGVFVPRTTTTQGLDESAAIHYRGQVGDLSELSLLGGSVLGNHLVGGAFESAWGGMGWRLEAVRYQLKTTRETFLFWIAGIDYQFEDGTLVAAEWYRNGHGASSESELATLRSDPLVGYGLQPQLAEHVLGLSLERDITPLLHGGYTLLTAWLDDERDHTNFSLLHQFTLSYSLSNESDLLFSLFSTTGKGLSESGELRSEFGYLPPTLTLRYRLYF